MEERFDFDYTGMYKVSAAVQITEFQKKLNSLTNDKTGKAKDWFEAFDHLKEYLLGLKKDRVVVFLDELPWMDTAKSNFMAAISSFWNGWRSKKTLLSVVQPPLGWSINSLEIKVVCMDASAGLFTLRLLLCLKQNSI